MTLIIFMLIAIAVLFLVRGWICKYSWLAVMVTVSIIMAMYSIMMMIALKGNYMPVGIIGYFDEKYFLKIVGKHVGYFSTTRIFNLSMAVYMVSIVNFASMYFSNYYVKYSLKWLAKKLLTAIFPVLYILFYDKQVLYWFYNQIMYGSISFGLFKAIDLFFTIGFALYLVCPLIYIAYEYIQSKLKYKKRQAVGVFIFVMCTDIILTIIYQTPGMHKFYLFEPVDALVNVRDIIAFGQAEYLSYLLSMIVLLFIIIYVIFKFDVMPKRGMLVRLFFTRNMHKINRDFFSIFHSVKKTIFMYKTLAERALNEDGEKSKELIRQLVEEINQYIGRINDMQQINNEPEIFMEKIYVTDIIDEVVSRYSNEKNIKITREYNVKNVTVEADSFYLSDVFDTIMKNGFEAIKAKKPCGNMVITLDVEHEWVIVKITDDGIGISEKDLKNIFKPLYTTKSRTTNWGLGLTFAMKIIKTHMGHIYIESILGEGSTVNILLPRIDTRR